MPFDGTLKFDTSIDQKGFKLGLDNLGGIAKAGMGAVTAAVGAATGAVTALRGYAVSVGESFESSMAQVIATMGITKDTVQDGVNSYELLKKAAADAGESTTFSASEAADALNYLALAGYSAAQASEALPAVLDLAAAGGLDLAYASDLATDAMAALGIEATKENLTAFGDQMAKTASRANTSVGQLGEAILTVGGTAKVLAGGTTELNAALGVLANRGIKGAEGGTHLRNMILSLSAPTDTAKQALDSLGVSALDAQGNMRPLNAVFADLQREMDGMSDGDTAAVLSDIFNKTDLAAAQAMIAGCGAEFDSLSAEIADCDGAMSDMAKTMNDTLEGDMKSLGSKAEAFGIAMYDSLNDPLRELAQLGGRYVSRLTEAFTEGSFDGLALELGSVLGDAVTQLAGYIPTLTDLGASLIASLAEGIARDAPKIARTGITAALTLLDGLADVSTEFHDLGGTLLTSVAEGVSKRLPRIRRITREVLTALAVSLEQNLPVMLTAGLEILEMLLGVLTENLPMLADAGIRIVSAVIKAIVTQFPALTETGLSLMETLLAAILDNLAPLLDAGVRLIAAFANALMTRDVLERLMQAGVMLLFAVTDALTNNLPVLLGAAVQIIAFLTAELLNPENVSRLFIVGFSILTALLHAVIDHLPLLIGAAVQVVEYLCRELVTPDNLTALLTAGVLILSAVLGAIIDNLPLLIDTAAELLDYLAKELVTPDNIARLIGAAGDILLLIVNAIVDNIDDLLIAVQEIILYLISELLKPENIKQLTETGVEILAALAVGLLKIAGSLAGFAYELRSEIKAQLDSVDWLALGVSILDGIIAGLTGLDGSFFGEFKDNFVTGLKEIFGIHSPSKLMRDLIGRNLALGVGEGFTENLPDFTPEIKPAAYDAFRSLRLPPLDAGEDLTVNLPDFMPEIEPAAYDALRTLRLQPLAADAPATSEIIHNHYSSTSITEHHGTSRETPDVPPPESSGDIIIPVSIGGHQLETVVIKAAQIANARSGGQTI